MNIYLAGGMKGDWQDRVMELAPEHTYFDPRSHGFTTPDEYTKWDLDHVAKSHLVFGYFEKSNPSGFGMCVEIGAAYAWGIPVILVDEKQKPSWGMVHSCSYLAADLLEGISLLRKFSNWIS